jgi:hypothetical protein
MSLKEWRFLNAQKRPDMRTDMWVLDSEKAWNTPWTTLPTVFMLKGKDGWFYDLGDRNVSELSFPSKEAAMLAVEMIL